MMLDKHTAQLLAQLNQAAQAQTSDPANEPGPPADITIQASREGARALFLGFAGPNQHHCRVEDRQIPTPDQDVPVRIYFPLDERIKDDKTAKADNNDQKLPLVAFIHGGGWCLGDLDCYDGLIQSLCQQSGAIFVSIDYRLAPENKFPAGLDDCLGVVRWLSANADSLGADKQRLALMGDSAGGNLALVACHQLQQELAEQLAALYLIYPVLDSHSPHHIYPSRVRFGDGDFLLTRDAITDTRDWYLDEHTSSDDPQISPLYLSCFSQLPPTSIMLAGQDPLYDEGRMLAEKLRDTGVLRRLHCFESTIHAFVSFGILPVADEARCALATQIKTDLTASDQAR